MKFTFKASDLRQFMQLPPDKQMAVIDYVESCDRASIEDIAENLRPEPEHSSPLATALHAKARSRAKASISQRAYSGKRAAAIRKREDDLARREAELAEREKKVLHREIEIERARKNADNRRQLVSDYLQSKKSAPLDRTLPGTPYLANIFGPKKVISYVDDPLRHPLSLDPVTPAAIASTLPSYMILSDYEVPRSVSVKFDEIFGDIRKLRDKMSYIIALIDPNPLISRLFTEFSCITSMISQLGIFVWRSTCEGFNRMKYPLDPRHFVLNYRSYDKIRPDLPRACLNGVPLIDDVAVPRYRHL